jgi:cellulose synthase/poly-beta-1,6-N-acetylglucosamine synthase-like glycosyltransferase
MNVFVTVLILVYGLLLSLLFVYGLNFYYLAFQARIHRGEEPEPPRLSEVPYVTVQLPIYNERFVVNRLIDAVAALDWPSDRLQIQVLDDSTDNTVRIAAATVASYRKQGLDIDHIRRENRVGYKAGALSNGLASAKGEFIAIFDADFLPSADYLKKAIPHFTDPRVGFVQARWDHLNQDYSLFTLLQSLSIDGHFAVEQFARFRCGFFMNFNGTAGIWRRETIVDSGGWSAATLTEDLDLSYRAQLNGWRPVYLRNLPVMAELPVSITAYRRQQYRWARGSFETARHMVPRIINSTLALRVKIQSLLHLTGYGIHALMFLLSLLYPLVVHLSVGRPTLVALFGIASLFNLTAFAPTTAFAFGQAELGRPWLRRMPAILFLSVFGSGMMVNNVRAILHAFSSRAAVFERTPKLGIVGSQRARESTSYKVKAGPLVIAEVAMLVFNLNTLRMALEVGHPFIAIYSGIFAAGLGYVLCLTGLQAIQAKFSAWHQGWLAERLNSPQEA